MSKKDIPLSCLHTATLKGDLSLFPSLSLSLSISLPFLPLPHSPSNALYCSMHTQKHIQKDENAKPTVINLHPSEAIQLEYVNTSLQLTQTVHVFIAISAFDNVCVCVCVRESVCVWLTYALFLGNPMLMSSCLESRLRAMVCER